MTLDITILLPFQQWLDGLKDKRTKAVIVARLRRLSEGNFGQTRSLRAGLSEMKVDFGPGYRLYFTREGNHLVVILTGGDKSTQERDIERAARILSHWKEQGNGA